MFSLQVPINGEHHCYRFELRKTIYLDYEGLAYCYFFQFCHNPPPQKLNIYMDDFKSFHIQFRNYKLSLFTCQDSVTYYESKYYMMIIYLMQFHFKYDCISFQLIYYYMYVFMRMSTNNYYLQMVNNITIYNNKKTTAIEVYHFLR